MKLVDLYGRTRLKARGITPRPALEPGRLEKLVRSANERAGKRPRPAPAAEARARLLEKRLPEDLERPDGGNR
jgi:hypothetical protein